LARSISQLKWRDLLKACRKSKQRHKLVTQSHSHSYPSSIGHCVMGQAVHTALALNLYFIATELPPAYYDATAASPPPLPPLLATSTLLLLATTTPQQWLQRCGSCSWRRR
jgi:hypothetical protein